eukprot:scaffold14543_cov30-Tisochrysis_lutea.AAC.5
MEDMDKYWPLMTPRYYCFTRPLLLRELHSAVRGVGVAIEEKTSGSIPDEDLQHVGVEGRSRMGGMHPFASPAPSISDERVERSPYDRANRGVIGNSQRRHFAKNASSSWDLCPER